jgi:hypothetical protein
MTYEQRLQKDYLLLQKQLFWLELAYKDVKKVKLQDNYEVDQFMLFEILHIRYIKSIDFLLMNSFISLDNYEFKNQFSQIELINNVVNRKIIENTDIFRDLFSLKIKLQNEYEIDKLKNHFSDLYFNTKILIKIINNTLDYINKVIR